MPFIALNSCSNHNYLLSGDTWPSSSLITCWSTKKPLVTARGLSLMDFRVTTTISWLQWIHSLADCTLSIFKSLMDNSHGFQRHYDLLTVPIATKNRIQTCCPWRSSPAYPWGPTCLALNLAKLLSLGAARAVEWVVGSDMNGQCKLYSYITSKLIG